VDKSEGHPDLAPLFDYGTRQGESKNPTPYFNLVYDQELLQTCPRWEKSHGDD
jgi:hypothetical protein